MLALRFASLAHRWPPTRRWMWKAWYAWLAARAPVPGWTCMNYGLVVEPPLVLTPDEEPERYALQLYDHVAAGAALVGRDVLEVGCGRGGGAAFLARRHAPRRFVGLDRTPAAVALCRRRFGRPGLTFEPGDAERLPFATESFDVVLNVESSHCYGDVARFLAEVRRVLRRGGHFLYADFRPTTEVAAWRALLEDAGFHRVAEEDVSPGVLASLRVDDARKQALIAALASDPEARGLFGSVLTQFAALPGSAVFEELAHGHLSYRVFTLERNDGPQNASASL